MASAVGFSYDYKFASSISTTGAKPGLKLATFGGAEHNPYFFDGLLENPRIIAEILLALSAVSRTRFFSPGMLRERMLAAADPVVTCDGNQLRFEVFSVCCGAYARFDLGGQCLDGAWQSRGTTNVDFNPPMRAALSLLQASDRIGLKVGTDSVELSKAEHTVVERKVKLPVRWLRSFVEVQSYQAMLKPAFEIDPFQLDKLLISLPQQNMLQPGAVTYIAPTTGGYRLSQRQVAGAVSVGAISRLKILESLLRHAKSVKVYGSDASISAFELSFREGKFFFVLSPNAARGFSGEGQSLSDLASRVSDSAIARVRANLAWQSNIDPEKLSPVLDLSAADIKNALQVLGTRGLVGFDIAQGCYFHRELPYDVGLVEELHPRLIKARRLIEEKGVKLESGKAADGTVTARVKGSGKDAFVRNGASEHLVQIKDDSFRCTCEWHAKYDGDRGPCSHVLAVELMVQELDA
ncbi:MAG: SWIM zinc finger family protein [Cyanobacteria bacterium SZAS LIN-3]|nr:SWIM zinc finger family protein [Cyanobacteria bacterium SZAS LIN-3]